MNLAHLIHGNSSDEDRVGELFRLLAESSAFTEHLVTPRSDWECEVSGYSETLNLYESEQLDAFAAGLRGRVAIDLTGLEHRVWAPLVAALLRESDELVALYAEPDDYRRVGDSGNVYDLSTSRGIEPIPGFASLRPRSAEDTYFAPLLGFEGARLAHIFDQEEVDSVRTSPVIGSPGFRLEYPTRTYLANRSALALDHMERRVELARASCPFEAYRALDRIRLRTSGAFLRIAPIGTKPHSLGAVLFAIKHPQSSELIYDHPVKSTGRSSGTKSIYVFEVTAFMNTLRHDG